MKMSSKKNKDTNEITKNMMLKNTCNKRILARHSKESIISSLVDFALDGYVESLKNENPNITKEEINQRTRALIAWKRLLSRD